MIQTMIPRSQIEFEIHYFQTSLFVCVDVLRPSEHYFRHVEIFHVFLAALNQY